jgi:hypothetical protein
MHQVQSESVHLEVGGRTLLRRTRTKLAHFPKGRAHHAPMETVASLLGKDVERDRLRQKVEVQFVSYVTS